MQTQKHNLVEYINFEHSQCLNFHYKDYNFNENNTDYLIQDHKTEITQKSVDNNKLNILNKLFLNDDDDDDKSNEINKFYIESNIDSQLLLTIVFKVPVKIAEFVLTAPRFLKNEFDERITECEHLQWPPTIPTCAHLYVNRPNIDFVDIEQKNFTPDQTLYFTPKSICLSPPTIYTLRATKFQHITNLAIFIPGNIGRRNKTRTTIKKIQLYGWPVSNVDISIFPKVVQDKKNEAQTRRQKYFKRLERRNRRELLNNNNNNNIDNDNDNDVEEMMGFIQEVSSSMNVEDVQALLNAIASGVPWRQLQQRFELASLGFIPDNENHDDDDDSQDNEDNSSE